MLRVAMTIGRAGLIGASSLLVIGAAVATTVALRALLRQQAETEWERQWQMYAEARGRRDEV